MNNNQEEADPNNNLEIHSIVKPKYNREKTQRNGREKQRLDTGFQK